MSDNKKPDFIRTNVSQTNTGTIPIPAEPIQRLISPIIYNPEEYNMYIERFTSNTNFPLFSPIVPPFGSPVTNMIISIVYGIPPNEHCFQVNIVISPTDAQN